MAGTRSKSLQKYGGKIFALGKVLGAPGYLIDEDSLLNTEAVHWRSKEYADISVDVLTNPIDIFEFHDFITVSMQGAVTGVWGNDFRKLLGLVCIKNDIPNTYRECSSCAFPITQVTKNNWMALGEEYRRAFLLESQFRSYYVDYLLRDIGDQKRIYRECRCKKKGCADTFVDNVIVINHQYLPVEVKFSVPSQKDIKKQAAQYCDTERIIIDKREAKEGYYYTELFSLSPLELNDLFEFKLGDATIRSCPLQYVTYALGENRSDELKQLCVAIVNYHRAAEEYATYLENCSRNGTEILN